MYQSFDLAQLQLDNPHTVSKNPFEHQKDAFEKMAGLFSFPIVEHKAGILVLPTGAGKTFTSVNWICRNVLPKNIKVLWLAHTGHLLEQAYDTFRSNLLSVSQRQSINMRLVSSDPMHSNAWQIDPSDDVLIITTQTAISNTETPALDERGQPRETALEKFLAHSRQTGLFVVLDEAHHAPAYGCRNLLIGGTRFREGISQKVPNSYFLGLTATPTYLDARRRGWLWEIFKDRIIYEVEKAALIDRGILAVPHYIQRNTGRDIPVDDSLYERLVRQHQDLPEDLIERLANDSGRNDYIINDYLDNYQTYRKTIIFADRWFQCVYIKDKLMQKARERGIELRVDAVYSHVDARANTVEERNQRNAAENARILEAFRHNELDVLLNVKMLSEGTDVPDVSTVIITRQTTSGILLTQMIGRALRGKAAGGGAHKELANIVFFVDNWQKIINFATPEAGETEDSEPLTRGSYPMEFISIELITNLSRQIDSGLVFAERAYLHSLPVGWYETDVIINVGTSTQRYREFVVVSEQCQPKFERFISAKLGKLGSEWDDESLSDEVAQEQAAEWAIELFEPIDNANGLLIADLVKLARHMAQTKQAPPFQAFAERNQYDLSQVAGNLLESNELAVQDNLQYIYHDSNKLWERFYKSYNRFKTAFDAERNRIYHIRKYGSEPQLNVTAPVQRTLEQRELTEEDKEKVFRRDNYTCQCCRKQRRVGRKVKFEVDHIVPFSSGGDTSLNNSQTLCKPCHDDKGINALNFRILRSPLLNPSQNLLLKRQAKIGKISDKEDIDRIKEELNRIINLFYYCRAVDTVNVSTHGNGKYARKWEVILFEGNNPAWLEVHKPELLRFIQQQLNCPKVEDITIR